jgi:hypothetical protein
MRIISLGNKWGKAEDKDYYFVCNESAGVQSFDADRKGHDGDAAPLAKPVGALELDAHDICLA